MDRNALQYLIEWKNNDRKKPLIVWGARQVGKTYLIKEYFKNRFSFYSTGMLNTKIKGQLRAFQIGNRNKKSSTYYSCKW